jgi:hypothetical protein
MLLYTLVGAAASGPLASVGIMVMHDVHRDDSGDDDRT